VKVRIGTSVRGRPLEAVILGRDAHLTVLVLGGIHGDEPKSVTVALRLLGLLITNRAARSGARWVVVPVVNPDGYERRKRRNANQVDINRNFPTENWVRNARRSRMFGGGFAGSEPETRAVMKAVARYAPERIIAIHSISGGQQCNNYDGPGRALAIAMSSLNGYPVAASIGYPTPGSLGTWAGVERKIATVTLELPAAHSPKRCWENNRMALLECGAPTHHRVGNRTLSRARSDSRISAHRQPGHV